MELAPGQPAPAGQGRHWRPLDSGEVPNLDWTPSPPQGTPPSGLCQGAVGGAGARIWASESQLSGWWTTRASAEGKQPLLLSPVPCADTTLPGGAATSSPRACRLPFVGFSKRELLSISQNQWPAGMNNPPPSQPRKRVQAWTPSWLSVAIRWKCSGPHLPHPRLLTAPHLQALISHLRVVVPYRIQISALRDQNGLTSSPHCLEVHSSFSVFRTSCIR